MTGNHSDATKYSVKINPLQYNKSFDYICWVNQIKSDPTSKHIY